MTNPIDQLKEQYRQNVAQDNTFLKRMLYFFELKIPAEATKSGSGSSQYIFPLIIPPLSYIMEEPFTVEATTTQGGGLYLEENGIIQRTIRLRGHTGFKPRTLNRQGTKAAQIPPQQTSFSRELPDVVIEAISGQKHFHYLQDTVFRTYGDLKRDPALAKDTQLIFHNPRDQEHWIVAPQRFTLTREASEPFLYTYDIELLVVDKAEVSDFDFSEDQSLFDSIKDWGRKIKKVVDAVTGAIQDITAVLGEVKSFVNDIAAIIDSVTAIMTTARNFVDGLTDFIESPFAAIGNAIDRLEASMRNVSELMETSGPGKGFPETTKNKFNQIIDGLEVLGRYPQFFENPTDARIRDIRTQQEFRRSLSTERKAEAESFGSPTTFDDVRNLGTQMTAGDVASAAGENVTGGRIRKYKSARQVTIQQGDTLASLAAKFLGDARQWQYIAIVNGLKPPFIDEQASAPLVGATSLGSTISGSTTGADDSPFPDALGVGSKILIPVNQTSTLDQTILPVSGARLEESVESQFLGTDLKLEAVDDVYGSSRAQYDIPIDTETGSLDVKLVTGIDNLAQSIVFRIITERGHDILYRTIGMQRLIGMGSASIDFELVQFRLQEALLSDPRIAAIHNLSIEQDADVLKIEMDVLIHGFTESRPIRLAL